MAIFHGDYPHNREWNLEQHGEGQEYWLGKLWARDQEMVVACQILRRGIAGMVRNRHFCPAKRVSLES